MAFYNFVSTKALNSTTDPLAPKDSPALTGTPTAPTATAGTNNTQIATTAFVKTAIDGASYVPTSRTVNSKALSSNITLTASDVGASASGHTHTALIAEDSGANQVTLSANTKYKLTAGGSTYIFTTPTDNDTKNTAGSTDTSSKIFLIGATSQANNPQTYSHDTAYVDTDGCLYSNSTKVSVEGHTHSYVPTSRTVNSKALSSNITLTASDVGAATSDHTHGLSIASDDGTSSISLSANTKYKLTAGGSTYVFTTPSDTNTVNTVGSVADDSSKLYFVGVATSPTSGTTSQTSKATTLAFVEAGEFTASKVHNAVWNDLTDRIPVDEECELEYGRAYCFDGEHYYKSDKYLAEGIIGIHSDTGGFEMGHKEGVKELQCSVAGFVLAYVDKEYKPGTPLTVGENGCLTEILMEDKIRYPERIVATYWKDEKSTEWGQEDKKVKVNGRKWVKIK